MFVEWEVYRTFREKAQNLKRIRMRSYEMQEFRPSVIAPSITAAARKASMIKEPWKKRSRH